MARREIIAGNWKMHKTHNEAVELASALVGGLRARENREMVLCPPYTALAAVAGVLRGTAASLGAQNLYWEEKGPYTGEISGPMLSALGCRYVIVGHSERRALFGENDAAIAKKLRAAFGAGLIPILCVGETLEEREAGRTEDVILGQLGGALDGWDAASGDPVIAYEPVWAIGTGRTAAPGQAQDVHALIRGFLSRTFGGELAGRTPILYGGSVKPGNAASLLGQDDIDGALVGGASLDADSFLAIYES